MGIADLHIHTTYSYDGTASVPAVLRRASQIGLDIIAITDHDEIRGALLAEQMAPIYNIQVIPGVEITTGEGDLLAFSIRKIIPAGLSLRETILRVGEQGGFCIAAHPMATGLGMNSLSANCIRQALADPETKRLLIGIETYNASTLDRKGNHAARLLAESTGVAQTGSSDAHISAAIGLGATVFPGKSINELMAAFWTSTTSIHKEPEWSAARVVGLWAVNYLLSVPFHLHPLVTGLQAGFQKVNSQTSI